MLKSPHLHKSSPTKHHHSQQQQSWPSVCIVGDQSPSSASRGMSPQSLIRRERHTHPGPAQACHRSLRCSSSTQASSSPRCGSVARSLCLDPPCCPRYPSAAARSNSPFSPPHSSPFHSSTQTPYHLA